MMIVKTKDTIFVAPKHCVQDVKTFVAELKSGTRTEVNVATSLEECERRDRKGLYKLAREGKIMEFTGISDPHEEPQSSELRVETEIVDVDICAHQVVPKLERWG